MLFDCVCKAKMVAEAKMKRHVQIRLLGRVTDGSAHVQLIDLAFILPREMRVEYSWTE